MRTLPALIACCLVMSMASGANDPALTPSAKNPVAGGAKPVEAIRPSNPGSSSSTSSAPSSSKSGSAPRLSEREREEQAEADLSAKIAARLAIMRANQAARVAAAAKAKKAAAVVAAAPKVYSTHWSYEGETGPANWGRINPEWAKCGSGNRQSPIDIRDGMKVELEQVSFDYKPSSFNVTDNGHTVQVMVSGGNFITVSNRMYELVQFHFHRPSEERINGKGYEMVLHMVHKDGEGHLAVIALLLERGKPQPVIQTVWNNLPLEKYETMAPDIVLDPMDLIPARRDYFTFMGSLTTPPCNEGVLWIVMKEPVQASPAQMSLFARLYPLNARPVQPSSGRIVKESN